VRFLRTGGQSMLKMMNMSEQQMSSMESKESHHDRSQLRH